VFSHDHWVMGVGNQDWNDCGI